MFAWLREIGLRLLSTLGLYNKKATVILLGEFEQVVWMLLRQTYPQVSRRTKRAGAARELVPPRVGEAAGSA